MSCWSCRTCPAVSEVSESVENLSHPCPADAQVAGESRPVFKLSGVEERLLVAGEPERVAWWGSRFFCALCRAGIRFHGYKLYCRR